MNSNNELTHLVLITDGYPYGPGEKPFASPELLALTEEYHVTLVAFASDEQIAQHGLVSDLPSEVELVTYVRPSFKGVSTLAYLPHALGGVFSGIFWRELCQLVSDGFSVPRLLDSIKQYALASHFRAFCKGIGLFGDADQALYFTFWFGPQLLALALERSRRQGMRLVSRIHGYDLYNERNPHGRQPFQRLKRDSCARILFVAEASRHYFANAFGHELFPGQYVTNRLGVSKRINFEKLEERCSLGPERPFTIVSCSSVIPLKRVGLIAGALKLLPDLDIHWVHFGDGPLLEDIRRMVADSDIRADFMGSVPNEDVLTHYADHRPGCLILVSETEGCPVCVQEALSFGMPIIVTDVGGVSETFSGNGVLLPAQSTADDVAQAIREVVLAPPVLWTSWSRASYRLWSERFDLHRNKRALLDCLSEVSHN